MMGVPELLKVLTRPSARAIALVAGLMVASCSPPVSSDRATRDDEQLLVTPVEDGVYCDGNRRAAATIAGAEAGETIEFTSPMPVEIADGIADQSGAFELQWACDELESELTWEITATGGDSGRTRTFNISGTDRDPRLDRILLYEPLTGKGGVLCDNSTQTVGRLSNAEPHEAIDFDSPDARSISPTLAGAGGEVEVKWTCSPDQDGSGWRLTATGRSSHRTVEFSFTGQAPQPADAGDIVVEIVENPFVCDRGRRLLARVANLTPNATLELAASPQGDSLRPAEADAGGSARLFWQCDRRDEGTTWELTVTEATPARRSATFSFGSTTLESPVTIQVIEVPFVCDGTTRQVAVLQRFVPREAVDFESPQAEAIRQGRADSEGNLPVRWTCDPDQAGTVWEITATGMTSGASLSFTITGGPP